MNAEEVSEQVLTRLQVIDRYEFEDFVADIFELAGWETEVTQDARDGGVDVIARQSGIVPKTALVQAKRPDPGNKVGYRDVTNYYRLKYEDEDTDMVVVVTSAAFTKDAYDYAREMNMKLMDGATLSGFVVAKEAFDVLDKYAPTAGNIEFDEDDFFAPDEEAREEFFGKRPVEFASSIFAEESIIEGIDQIQDIEHGRRRVEAMDRLGSLVDGTADASAAEVFGQHPRLINQNWYDVAVQPDVSNMVNDEAELSDEPPNSVEVMIIEYHDGVAVTVCLPVDEPITQRGFSYLVDCRDFVDASNLVEGDVNGSYIVGGSERSLERKLARYSQFGFRALTYEEILERSVRTNSDLLQMLRRIAESSGDDEMRERTIRLQELAGGRKR